MDKLAEIRERILPFAKLLGIEYVFVAPDKIVAEMLVRDDLCTRPLTLHGGEPVEKGEKWIITKWMRQRSYGLAAPAEH